MSFSFDAYDALAAIENDNAAKVAIPAKAPQNASKSADFCDSRSFAKPARVANLPKGNCSQAPSSLAAVQDQWRKQKPAETLAVSTSLAEIAALARDTKSSRDDPCDHGGFSERAAILEYDAGMSRPEAEDQAAQEAGFADARAYRAHLLAYWRHHLQNLKARGLSRSAEAYADAALTFVETGWAEKCLLLGWTEAELVWADVRAPWARVDNLGAAYLSRDVQSVTAESIVCGVRGGHPLILRRARGDGRVMPPWQELGERRA